MGFREERWIVSENYTSQRSLVYAGFFCAAKKFSKLAGNLSAGKEHASTVTC